MDEWVDGRVDRYIDSLKKLANSYVQSSWDYRLP
jgi:hypothetical protein